LGVAKRENSAPLNYSFCLTALFFVYKPDRSEHGVQRSKAKSREKCSYETQVGLSKSKKTLDLNFVF
jgi:hypothetical protein